MDVALLFIFCSHSLYYPPADFLPKRIHEPFSHHISQSHPEWPLCAYRGVVIKAGIVGSRGKPPGAALNEDESLANGENLFIGTGAKAYRANEGWAAEPLISRADAGAEFIQTQLCLNMDLLRNWMQRLVEAQVTWRYSIIVSLTCLPSAETARWVKENMSDSKIPKGIIERLEQAADPEQEGIAICAEKMQQIAEIPGISGVNLVTMGNPEHLAAAIDLSKLREQAC